jgi:pimeloyl-ACP methyl ester carboxylesterase
LSEETVLFGRTRSLVGIITDPPQPAADVALPAFIILNAGIVHRVGPHRLFVKLARRLATLGFVVLRFDHSGIGDSDVRADKLPFEASAVSETQEAMECLSRLRGSKQFVLVGLCSGTLTSFKTACADARVVGAVLLNALLESPETISESTVAYVIDRKIARSYLHEKLFHAQSWLKFLTGAADYKKILRVLSSQISGALAPGKKIVAKENPVLGDLRVLFERGVNLIFVYSEGTGVLEYFQLKLESALRKINAERWRIEVVRRTDHTFTLLRHQEELLQIVGAWAGRTLIGCGAENRS